MDKMSDACKNCKALQAVVRLSKQKTALIAELELELRIERSRAGSVERALTDRIQKLEEQYCKLEEQYCGRQLTLWEVFDGEGGA